MSGRLNPPTRAARTDNAEPTFAPSEEWRATLEAQATKPTLERLNRIARARLAIYVGGKQYVHDADVDDIVIGALGDTFTGTIAWDPERRSLFLHLRDAIKYRVRDQAKLTRRRDHEFEEDDCGESIEAHAAAGGIKTRSRCDRTPRHARATDDRAR